VECVLSGELHGWLPCIYWPDPADGLFLRSRLGDTHYHAADRWGRQFRNKFTGVAVLVPPIFASNRTSIHQDCRQTLTIIRVS